jgi:hypothetical protein
MFSSTATFATDHPQGTHGVPASSAPSAPRGTMDEREAELDAELREMQDGYRASGGLTSGDAIASRLRVHAAQPISVLARWIVGRNVVVVHWRSQTWLPLFQFHLHDMSLRADVQPIVPVLGAVLGDWQVARWFARPNAQLGGALPADELARDPARVLQAAVALSASLNGSILAH